MWHHTSQYTITNHSHHFTISLSAISVARAAALQLRISAEIRTLSIFCDCSNAFCRSDHENTLAAFEEQEADVCALPDDDFTATKQSRLLILAGIVAARRDLVLYDGMATTTVCPASVRPAPSHALSPPSSRASSIAPPPPSQLHRTARSWKSHGLRACPCLHSHMWSSLPPLGSRSLV
jgi:hypothetical protein